MSSAAFPADIPGPSRALGPGGTRVLLLAGFVAWLALLGAAWWALSRLLPDQFTLSLLGHDFVLRRLHDRVLGIMPVLAILPSVLWLECAVVGWTRSSARALLKPSASVRTDLACFVLEQFHVMGLVGRLMMLGASIISGIWLRDWLAARTGLAVDPAGLPLLVQVPVYFFAYSFFDYWAHRAGHLRIFWPLHRYHHAAEEFSVINGGRLHPAGFVGIFFLNIPMPLLGATPEAMIWVNVVTTVLGFLIHSRIESGWGWIGRHIVQSPRHHRLHHKLDMSTPTGFFGMMPIWDRLFGGWSERNDRNVVVGVDTEYRHGFWVGPDLLRDYFDFWKGLVGRRELSPSERRD